MLSVSTLAGMASTIPRTTLITGASSGLGAEFAAQFARRGGDVVLLARREDRLRELADRLTRDHDIRADVIALDLGEDDAAALLRERLDAAGLRIDGLINNAGFGMHGAVVDSDPEVLERMLRLNINALVALTREFLPDILATGGTLVNLASVVAHQPLPTMAAYGASKSFVLNFTEALAYEARGTGARVLAVSPGPTRTEFFDVVGDGAAVGGFQTAEQVVTRAMRALDARFSPGERRLRMAQRRHDDGVEAPPPPRGPRDRGAGRPLIRPLVGAIRRCARRHTRRNHPQTAGAGVRLLLPQPRAGVEGELLGVHGDEQVAHDLFAEVSRAGLIHQHAASHLDPSACELFELVVGGSVRLRLRIAAGGALGLGDLVLGRLRLPLGAVGVALDAQQPARELVELVAGVLAVCVDPRILPLAQEVEARIAADPAHSLHLAGIRDAFGIR